MKRIIKELVIVVLIMLVVLVVGLMRKDERMKVNLDQSLEVEYEHVYETCD